MYYNGCNKIDLTDIMYSPKKVVSFNPSYPFTFTVKLSDNNAVETVNIVSTKGSDIRRIKAIYDEDTDQWVAKGYFDNNHSYVPGILSVEYDQKKENYTIDINAELPQTDKENLPEEIQNATGSVIRNTYNNNSSEGESIIDVTLADEDHSHVFIGTKTESIPEGKAGNYSIEKLIDDGYVEFSSPDNKKFLVNAFETTDGKFVTDYLEFTKKGNSWEATQTQTTVVSITSDLLESDEWGLARDIILNHVFDAMKDPWGGFSGPVADLIFKMGDEEKRTEQINNATNRIRSMNISQEEKQRRLEQLHNINCLRAVNFGLSLLPTVIGIGVGIFFPGAGLAFGLGSALLGYLWGINYSYLFDSQLRNLMYCDMRWAVDPSGYVYEAVPSNRLEGVTTTIYYKDAKGEEILWDASEYEQLNPIQTDADGLYAWDVPEGEWRVKYEMEGYQTKYSEWMPVPPIQTDVNIGMISEANPTIGGFEMYEDYAVLSFDKYMDVSTVTDSNITVKGQDGNFKVFIVEPVDEENVDGTKLAKVFRLRFGETLSWGVYTISVGRGVKDYAGFTLKEDYKEEGQIKKTIESFEVTVPEEIRTKQTVTIPVSILPEGDYSEYQISCSSSMEDIAKVESVSEIDSCGNANIILEAKLPGTVILTAKLEGTSFEKNVKVDILSAEEMEISPSTVDISTCDVSLEENSYSFDGNAKEPAVVVMNGDITLERDVDYTVSYSNNISVGTATMIITGEGNCTGTITKTFKITKASQSITVKSTASSIAVDKTATVSITGNKGTKSYKSSNTAVATVDPKTGKVTAKKVGTVKITATSSATSNYNAASKTVTIKVVKGTQSITAKTSVSPIAVGKTATVSITGNKGTKSFKSSNTAIATVTSAGKVTAKKVGTVTITATSAATSNYNTASKTVTIKVVPAATSSVTAANQATGIKLTWKKVAGATGYKVYRGSTLLKTIKSGSTVVCTDTKANTNGTKYTFKIVPTASTGNGTSKSLTTYRVAKPAVKTVKNSASKKMTVTWGKNAKGTGYQIQYSTDKSFKSGNKTATVTKASTVSKVIGSLTKGKTYYVRIRTYKTVGSKKYWSAWSATKSVKISK